MAKPGRNELCSCGSGKKYKRCCALKSSTVRSSRVLLIVVGAAILAAIAAGVTSVTNNQSAERIWDPAHGHYHDANGVQVP